LDPKIGYESGVGVVDPQLRAADFRERLWQGSRRPPLGEILRIPHELPGPLAFDVLSEVLNHPLEEARGLAITALGALKDERIAALAAAQLGSESAEVRWRAAQTLRFHPHAPAARALARLLRDPSQTVRLQSCAALEELVERHRGYELVETIPDIRKAFLTISWMELDRVFRLLRRVETASGPWRSAPIPADALTVQVLPLPSDGGAPVGQLPIPALSEQTVQAPENPALTGERP
jgi:HEAT repeat protein